ncbi:MAG: class I SAM-dependent methyltransferase [Candidatus Hodarchaeota archaeon]
MGYFENYNQQFQDRFDYQQQPLHIYSNEYWSAREKIAERFIKHGLSNYLSKIEPIDTVLDLACGGAYFGRNIVESFGASKFWCIDINPLQLNLARELNSELINVETSEVQLDIGKDSLPISTNSIDVAIMVNSIYYLANSRKIKLFKEVGRCLRPDGRFILSIENSLYWRNTHPYFPSIPFFWLYPKKIAEKVLSRAGFSEKLPKFDLHYHESAHKYLRLLGKAKTTKVVIFLTNTLEYDKMLSDHASLPFPNNDIIEITTNSRKRKIIKYFNIFQHRSFGDKIYSNFAKCLIHLKLHRLAFLTAPRIVFLVQF